MADSWNAKFGKEFEIESNVTLSRCLFIGLGVVKITCTLKRVVL